MKEGASNYVERHLTITTLPFYGHILKWGVSVDFIANALRRTLRVCVIPRAVRKRTYVYIRRWRVAIVNCDSRSQRWSRKGKARSKGSESGKPRRHVHRPAKRSRLLEAKLRSKTVSRPPQMTAQLGHFQLLTPRGNSKRVYSTGGSGQTIINPLECSGW